MAVTNLGLKIARKRMARSMKKLFDHIAVADQKALVTNPNATPIFPVTDAALMAATSLVYTRLTTVLAL